MKQPGTLSGEKCKVSYGSWKGSCKTSSKGFLQGSCQGPSKGSCKIPASQFQQEIVAFQCLPQLKKRKKQNNTQNKSRSCLLIGSSKVAKRFQKSSSQTLNITTRHIKQSKNEYSSEISAIGSFQQGCSKVPAEF